MTKPTPTLAIVLESFDESAEQLVHRLSSLVPQGQSIKECWLLCDSSKQSQYQVLLKKQRWPWPVLLIPAEGEHLSQSRHHILLHTQADYLLFWQNSYQWQPHFLEALSPALSEQPSLLLTNCMLKGPQTTLFELSPGFRQLYHHASWKAEPLSGSGYSHLLAEPVCTLSSMVMQVKALRRSGGFQASLPETAQAWESALKLSLQGSILITPYPWVVWEGEWQPDALLAYIDTCQAIYEHHQAGFARLSPFQRARAQAKVSLAWSYWYASQNQGSKALRAWCRSFFCTPMGSHCHALKSVLGALMRGLYTPISKPTPVGML